MTATYEASDLTGSNGWAMQTPAEARNALVKQKDQILAYLSIADDADDFEEALVKLRLVADLWQALGYGYKAKEIAANTINAMYRKKTEAEDMLDCSRRNTSQWKIWDAEIGHYDVLITDACIARSKYV